MKKFLLTISLLSLATFVGAKVHKIDGVDISNTSIEKVGDSVAVRFDITVPKSVVGGEYKLIILPEMYAGSNNTELAPIVVRSSHKRKIDRRWKALSHRDTTPEGAVIVQGGEYSTYMATVRYMPWMGKVSIRTSYLVEGCCNSDFVGGDIVAKDRTLSGAGTRPTARVIPSGTTTMAATEAATPTTTAITPIISKVTPSQALAHRLNGSETYLLPSSEYVNRYKALKEGKDHDALKIFFRQKSTDVEPDFEDNRATLDRLIEAIDALDEDPSAALSKIVVVGYASPEGSLDLNTKLAQRRGDALAKYLAQRSRSARNSRIEVINGSEDWVGLRRLIVAGNMSHKSEVLNIIDNIGIMDGREKILMDLRGGVPYKYMLANYFPQLRNAGYVMIYYETTPGGSEDQATYQINRAIDLIKLNRYDEALEILLDYKTNRAALNPIGVCYNALGNTELAMYYLTKAAEAGDRDAKANLSRIGE